MLATRAADASCALVYVNQVGGQDELVFDGASMVFDADGELAGPGRRSSPSRRWSSTSRCGRCSASACSTPGAGPPRPPLPVVEVSVGPRVDDPADAPSADGRRRCRRSREVYEALVLGTRDYVRKNGFTDVVIGLSGGIDSSLVAAIAVDALGPEHVHGVLMPSRYSTDHSLTDAEKLAAELGIDHRDDRHRAGPRRLRSTCWRRPSPGRARTSPRRTSSPASGACC